MRLLKQFLLLPFILFSFGLTVRKNNVSSYEGLFYLDRLPVRVEVIDGKIASVTRIKALSEKDKNTYIGPGIIDNQVNGYSGVTFSLGDARFTHQDVIKVTNALWKEGVTTYLPTLRTNSQENLLKNLQVLAVARKDPKSRGSIAGYHMEGPYISKEDGYRGAHALTYVRDADWNSFMELYKVSEEKILQVTLAPEAKGAMDFISKCRSKNIVVGLGHHNASTAQITEAIDRGAQIATHLGNALANNINRRENPLWPQLSDDRLMISIICDGFHLLPEQIRVFYKIKGAERTIITSDVDKYAGMNPGKYPNSEGDTIQLTTEGAVMYLARNALSGSASPVTKGVGNIMKFTGCTMADAFRMASSNPAQLYGLNDRGEIRPGLRADLILFEMQDSRLNIKRTIVNGELVYDAKN